jgi:hypothetical protein
MLKTYQGHGTTLPIDDLARYVRSLGGGVKDYILLTDAGIENIGEVVEYLSKVQGRLTIIWLKTDTDFDDRFRENHEFFTMKLPASVTFVEVADVQDIPRIAVGRAFGEVYGSAQEIIRKES